LSQRRRRSGNRRHRSRRGGQSSDVVFDVHEGLRPNISIRGKAVGDILQAVAGLDLKVADCLVKLGNSFCQFREGGVRRGNGSKELGTMACYGVDAQPTEDGAIRQHGDGEVEDHDELGSVFVLGERLKIAVLSRKLGLEGGNDESNTAFVVKRIHGGIHRSEQFSQ
jgi:hypothetical protein